MDAKSVASIARIGVLVVLFLGAMLGGDHQVSTQSGSEHANIPEPVPTEVAIVDLTSAEDAAPTAETAQPTTESVPPTTEPISEPAPTTTQKPAPMGRGDFPVPENTTGRSIVIERGPEDQNFVALTFDAGEGAGYTTEILDILKTQNLKASFGVTGQWAREYPELVNRILDEGHLLFNHSESHRSWTGSSPGTEPLSPEERAFEVTSAHDSVTEVAEWNMQPFWRPPYGDLDAEGQQLLETLGYDYTFWWTCDTLAWMGTSAAEIAAKCASDTDSGGPGAIILMHVSQEQDYLAVETIIADYQAEGYEFVTLDRMIGD